MGRIAATELMPDFAGRSLDRGRYRLLETLGAGAYGKVYRAIEVSPSSTQKVFAVKCLNKPVPGSHADMLQRREFAHHQLVSSHPNIVTFHRSFSDGLYVYVVLDLCTGGDLFSAITEKRLFHKNGRLIKHAFVQLIDAVQYCHEQGVYHRDIKPENVLCSDDGTEVRLADFGLSTMSVVCQDFGCGSSYYMSPECIGRPATKGHYATRQNDVWALGVILTNMITGRNPWRYAIAEDDCFAAYLHDNDFLQQVLPISDGVNKILKGAFTLSPSMRITLPQLRKDVLDLTSFFVDERDLTVERAAEREDAPAAAAAKPETPAGDRNGPSSTSFKSMDSDEVYLFSSPDVDHPPIQSPVHGQSAILKFFGPNDFAVAGSADSLAVPSSASSASSGPESKGPITPATCAVDVDLPVDIPDISGEGLGYPVDLANDILHHKAPVSTHKLKKPVDIFRSAVQRIKILSRAEPSP